MGWQKEYLPISAKENSDYLKNKKQTITFAKGTGSYEILENHMPDLRFSITAEKTSAGTPLILELSRIYYPGYLLFSESGDTLPLTMSPYGLLQAEIPGNGTYTLHYVGTPFVRTARKISVFTVIVSVLGYFCIIGRSFMLSFSAPSLSDKQDNPDSLS